MEENNKKHLTLGEKWALDAKILEKNLEKQDESQENNSDAKKE